jgi:hypothetical protein
MRRVSLVLVCLVAAMPLRCFAQSLSPWSVWQNQSSSLLIVTTVDAKGNFNGTFINGNTNYICVGVPVQMTGTVDKNNNVVAVANFAPCTNTITIWKGALTGKTLPMHWTLTYVDSNGTFQTQSGQDTFNQIN